MFKEAQRRTLAGSVAKQFLEAIRSGALKPGDKLPPERKLMQQFKVSRSSLREALQALMIGGFIIARPGQGTYVNTVGAGQTIDSDALASILEKEALIQLMEVRNMLEIGMAALAAERATEEDLKELSLSLADMERAAMLCNASMGTQADLDFHNVIAQITKNIVILKVLNPIYSLLVQSRHKTTQISLSTPEMAEETVKAHRWVYKAICSHDKDEAERAMRAHLEFIAKIIRNT